jgi:hypothetical protein
MRAARPQSGLDTRPKTAEVNVPEVKIPRMAVPAALREMTVEDVMKAIPDVRIELPKSVDLSKIELPKLEMPAVELPKVDLSKAPGPLRRRRRTGLPWTVLAVFAGLLAGAWLLISSPTTGPRIRTWIQRVRARMDGTSVPDDVRPFPVADRAPEQPSPYEDEPEETLGQPTTGMTGAGQLAGGVAVGAIGRSDAEDTGAGSGAAAGGGATSPEPA